MTSPFQYGREMRGAEFVDRVDEVDQVFSTLLRRERLFLIGPRRFDKTSILVTATERAEADGALILYVNAEKFAGTREIAAELIRQADAKLKRPVAQVMQRLEEVFRVLQPSINYDPLTDAWSVKLAAAVESGEVVLLDLYDLQYATLQSQLTPNQRMALLAAARSPNGTSLTSAGTARTHRLAVYALRRALGALVEKGILREV